MIREIIIFLIATFCLFKMSRDGESVEWSVLFLCAFLLLLTDKVTARLESLIDLINNPKKPNLN
jgi:diacylglycerol kinase